MNDTIRAALLEGQVIDITTTGRKTGQPRRKEIVFHNIDGRVYISGVPRLEKRDWLANLEADPHFVFHLKGDVVADLPATARVITDPEERRQVLGPIAEKWGWEDLEDGVHHSPLVEVTIDE
jgi:deazaflavin-dependent oxidoreductase (nitroreductase family)